MIFRYMRYVLFVPMLGFVSCFKQQEQAREYNIQDAMQLENVVPVAIIGSGPAGLTSALYVARAGMKSFVFAGPTPCGQLTGTTYIENWPGRDKVLGAHLMNDIQNQVLSFGASIINDTIVSIDSSVWPFSLKTEEGHTFKALSIILATGATPKKLGIVGESEYWGKGVTTCAVCDAAFCKNKEVVISGGGDSAAEMVFELAPYVKKVTMLVRKDRMRAAVAMQERVLKFPNATVEYHKEIKQIYGENGHVSAIDVYDNQTNQTERRDVYSVFLAIGHDPNNSMIQGAVPLNDEGYVKMVERSQESLVPGIFAAGEIQDPSYRQAIVAAGEGAKAALDAASFLYDHGFTVEIGKKLDQQFFQTFNKEKLELKEIFEVSELEEHVLNTKGLVLLDFYATTCPGCIKMLPILQEAASKFKDQVTILKVNYDKVYDTIFKELWHEHGIKVRKLPSLLVFKDGKYLEMNTNIMSRKEVVAYISKFL